MLKLALSILICSFAFATHGQERSALLFNLTQSNNNYGYNDLFPEGQKLESAIILPVIDQFGLSFRKSKDSGKFYEITLASRVYLRSIETNRPIDPVFEERVIWETYNFDLHLRLEAGELTTIASVPNLSFGISTSIDPRFTFGRYVPTRNYEFEFNAMNFETSLNLNPQIEYSINDRIIFLVKIPIQLLTLNSIYGRQRNPNVRFEEQDYKRNLINILPIAPTYSFGVGYYITHRDR